MAFRAPSLSEQSQTTRSIFMPKDDMPPAHSAAGRKKAQTAWMQACVTGIVGANLPDERNSSSSGSFQAVEAAAKALPADGHLCVQANGTVSAVPDYPSLVQIITDWYHAAARGNPLLKCTVILPEVLGFDVRAIARGPRDGTPIRIFGIINDYHVELVDKVNEIRAEHGLGRCELEDINDMNAAPVTASVNPGGRLRSMAQGPFPQYTEVVVCGVFDHLNNADKALLTVAAIVADRCLIVGVAEGRDMLEGVAYKEFVQSYDVRVAAIQDFVKLVKPDLRVQAMPSFTPVGLGADEKNAECLVIDSDSISVAAAVNASRTDQGWDTLDTLSIDLAYYPEGKPEDDEAENLYEDDHTYGHDDWHEKPVIKIDSATQRAAKAKGWVTTERLGGYK